MNIAIGKAGTSTEMTFQDEWPETVPCATKDCGAMAELAITVAENQTEDCPVYTLHDNDFTRPDGEGFWPHDYISVAVYICRKCGKLTARMNQA